MDTILETETCTVFHLMFVSNMFIWKKINQHYSNLIVIIM